MPASAKKPAVAKKLPAVPESKIKIQKTKLTLKAKLLKLKKRRHAVLVKRRIENFHRAEKYEEEYKKLAKNEINLERSSKKEGSYYIPAEPKLAFVVRIRG